MDFNNLSEEQLSSIVYAASTALSSKRIVRENEERAVLEREYGGANQRLTDIKAQLDSLFKEVNDIVDKFSGTAYEVSFLYYIEDLRIENTPGYGWQSSEY